MFLYSCKMSLFKIDIFDDDHLLVVSVCTFMVGFIFLSFALGCWKTIGCPYVLDNFGLMQIALV